MSLNFPTNTSLPYIDPTTGLKYIYNNSIGAWEAAIQPPVIISDFPPGIDIPGFLYWDKQEGQLYILYNDGNSRQWVVTNPSLNTRPVKEDSVEPLDARPGDLWFNTTDLKLYYLYFDGVDSTWISISSSGTFARNSIGPLPPSTPSVGDFWWNNIDGKLYVFYNDGNSSQWVDLSGPFENSSSALSSLGSSDSSILIEEVSGNTVIRVDIDALPVLP
jgi:hypothetical protein